MDHSLLDRFAPWPDPDEGAAPTLVVADTPTARRLLWALLRGRGLAAEPADDAPEIVRLALRRRPSVVVLDLGFAPSVGEELIDRLRAAYGAELLLVALAPRDAVAAWARRLGAVACDDGGHAQFAALLRRWVDRARSR